MGQENYKISQLPEKTSADSTDLMEVSTLVDSSYESKKISVGQIAETAMGTMTYEDLTTTAKTIVGAINELVNSGPSINVEALSVTDNGTYTAPEGSAYSPVTVNVKSEIEHDGSTSEWWDDSYLVPITVDGNPVTLNSPVAQNAISTLLSYSPKQSGSGDPSPQNIRPIEGWTEANLLRSRNNIADSAIQISPIQSGNGDPSPTNIRPISAGLVLEMDDHSTLSVYGGNLNPITGTLSVTHKKKKLNELTFNRANWGSPSNSTFSTTSVLSDAKAGTLVFCTTYKPTTASLMYGTESNLCICLNNQILRLRNSDYETAQAFMDSLTNADEVVYELAEPITYNLSQTELARALTALETMIYPISLGGTYYGFSVDVERGVLRVDRAFVTFNGSEGNKWIKSSSALNGYYIRMDEGIFGPPMKNSSFLLCNMAKYTSSTSTYFNNYGMCYSDYTIGINVDPQYCGSTVTDFCNWLSNNNVSFVYELREPLELPLTPQTVALLAGNNTIWTDGDEVSVTYKASIQQNQLSALNSSLSFGDPMSTQTTDESEMEELDTVPDITDDTETNIVSNQDVELDGLSDIIEED